METLWFCLVAAMLAAYVVLDGYDLGAGIVHLWVARAEDERRAVLASIGPLWDGNEVWLLATGGTLFFAFPGLYASSFSGFYLPLMIVLWLLILRGISIEFRSHLQAPVWRPFWDSIFAGSSALLTIFFGAALGNVVRGVPLDGSQVFFLPLWTDFNIGSQVGILDWYTVLVGLLAFTTLTVHGALWVARRTEGPLSARSSLLARRVWPAVVALTVVVTAVTFRIQPHVPASFTAHPWGLVFPVVSLLGLAAMRRSFLGSSIFIAGMLASAAFGLFPYVLPSTAGADLSLTIHNTAAAPHGLAIGLAWWIPGMILATGYSIYSHRHFAGRISSLASGGFDESGSPSCLLFWLVPLCPAQMSADQKIADFNQIVALYDKNYGPYEWKKTAFQFDLLNTGPWLSRILGSKDDLDFYEICIEYIASLMDAHDVFTLPSDFTASLGFTADVYDGKVLIDSITTSRLPPAQYPFQVGDELVSVDGTTAKDLLQTYAKYAIAANPDSTSRNAASRIVSRSQSSMPHAHQIGAAAAVVIRRQNSNLETYQIPWVKSGTPLTFVGPVPPPKSSAALAPRLAGDPEPDYMQALRKVQYSSLAEGFVAVRNFGSRTPIFSLPQGFVQRLGASSADVFYSGTFSSGGYKIGFIRIPSFSPSSTSTAVSQFQTEIAYFQSNTDGLIVDDMRNPGGSVCYCEQLVSYLMPGPFRVLGYQLRATMSWIQSFSYSLTAAQSSNASQDVIDLYTSLLAEVQAAYAASRGNTGPVPLCGTSLLVNPPTDRTGKIISYTKPVMLLTDNFSASAGDAFAAMFQDAARGPVFGTRTMGAGGNVVDFAATNYSEGHTRVTESLMVRKDPVVTPDYPTALYVENVGVRPDIAVDFMTLDNLLNNGRTYVAAFTAAMVDLIEKSQSQQSQ